MAENYQWLEGTWKEYALLSISMETLLITEGKAEGLVEKAFSPVRSAAWYSRVGGLVPEKDYPW